MTQSIDPRQSDDVELPLIQHLKELRTRLLRCLAVVLGIFLSLAYFAPEIYTFVATPMQRVLPEGTQMIAFEVASPFLTPFKLTFYVSLFLAMPFILHQVWSFIAPALYRHEKRIAIPLFISSVVLFYVGVAFAYFIVFPLMFGFFTSIAPGGIQVAPDIASYLTFVLTVSFAFGLAFETPVATVLLIWAGIVSADDLAKKRPYIVIGCFVVGMMLTPPDVFSQVLLAVPMWLLFEVGVFFGRWITPTSREEADSSSQDEEQNKIG